MRKTQSVLYLLGSSVWLLNDTALAWAQTEKQTQINLERLLSEAQGPELEWVFGSDS